MTKTSTALDADAYWQAGQIPWTIFAYPASLADSQRLPLDDDARRWLATLQSTGLRVGIWSHPAVKDTVYFACPFEDMMAVQLAIEDLERRGIFPRGFASHRCEYLFSLARNKSVHQTPQGFGRE